MTSWKTTVAGICAIIAAVAGAVHGVLVGGVVDWTSCMSAVMAGIGLISAKDKNVTNSPNPTTATTVK